MERGGPPQSPRCGVEMGWCWVAPVADRRRDGTRPFISVTPPPSLTPPAAHRGGGPPPTAGSNGGVVRAAENTGGRQSRVGRGEALGGAGSGAAGRPGPCKPRARAREIRKAVRSTAKRDAAPTLRLAAIPRWWGPANAPPPLPPRAHRAGAAAARGTGRAGHAALAPGSRPGPCAVDQGTGGTTLHHNPEESSGAAGGGPPTRSAPCERLAERRS